MSYLKRPKVKCTVTSSYYAIVTLTDKSDECVCKHAMRSMLRG